jgi:TRAP-type uncharacterized transport system fused permease subunit
MRRLSDGLVRLLAAIGTRTGLRMTGWQYLSLVWIAWSVVLLCTLFIALIEPTGALLLSVLLAFWARSNVTGGRRVAARIDACRRR